MTVRGRSPVHEGGRELVARRPLRAIRAITVPDTWWGVPLEGADNRDWLAETVGALSGDPQLRPHLTEDLQRIHDGLQGQSSLAAALWVPEPSVATVAGFMTVTCVVPPEDEPGGVTPEGYVAEMDPRDLGRDVVDHRVDEVALPAGPGVVLRQLVAAPVAPPWRRALQHNVVYTVFPLESTDALELAFVTYALELVDELEADAAAVAASVRVTVDDQR